MSMSCVLVRADGRFHEARPFTADAPSNDATCPICLDPFDPSDPSTQGIRMSACRGELGHHMHRNCWLRTFRTQMDNLEAKSDEPSSQDFFCPICFVALQGETWRKVAIALVIPAPPPADARPPLFTGPS